MAKEESGSQDSVPFYSPWAIGLANFILRIGTPKWYRDTLKAAIRLGLAAAEDDDVFNKLLEKRRGNS